MLFTSAGQISGSNLYVPHGEVSTRVWFLLPLRLYVGFQFIMGAVSKIEMRMLTQSTVFSEYIEQVQNASGGSMDSLYDRFIDGVVQPHIGFFAMLIIFGQLIIGLGLLVGAFTRFFAALGIVFLANVFFLHGVSIFQPHYSVIFILILCVLIMTNAGMAYGIDHRLRAWSNDRMHS